MKELSFDKLYVKFSNLYCEYRSRKKLLELVKAIKNPSEEFVELTSSKGGEFDITLSLEETASLLPALESSISKYESNMKKILVLIKERGQLEAAKEWHDDDWGNNFVEEFCKKHCIE